MKAKRCMVFHFICVSDNYEANRSLLFWNPPNEHSEYSFFKDSLNSDSIIASRNGLTLFNNNSMGLWYGVIRHRNNSDGCVGFNFGYDGFALSFHLWISKTGHSMGQSRLLLALSKLILRAQYLSYMKWRFCLMACLRYNISLFGNLVCLRTLNNS